MLVEIESIEVRLGGVQILKDVSLHVAAGQICGLLGPNGAGKTTTIAAALGLLKPERGAIRVLGKDPAKDAVVVHGRTGLLPENNGFYDWMTADDYLTFFTRLHGRQPSTTEITGLIARVGLNARPGQAIGTYSRGMRQRLGIARALIGAPELLVLDEPTNGLDPRGRREVHDLLIELSSQRNVGVLLCTHLLDDVDRLCSHVSIMAEGRTLAEGPMVELLRKRESSLRFRLRLGRPVPNDQAVPASVKVIARTGDIYVVDVDPALSPDAAWRSLLFDGWPIAEITRQGGGLEELYLGLTERRAL